MIPVSPTRADIEGRLKEIRASLSADVLSGEYPGCRCKQCHILYMLNLIATTFQPTVARFDDMSRIVRRFQQAKANWKRGGASAVQRRREPFVSQLRELREAESALLALQTETHDGK